MGRIAVTNFIWNEQLLVEEHTSHPDGTAKDVTSWVYHDQLVLSQTVDRHRDNEVDRRFEMVIGDLVGTPTHLIDPDTCESSAISLSAWGVPLDDVASRTPLRFPGHYADTETGWHYNYHRHYDPLSGRYSSPDPLGIAPARNPYSYVRNPFSWSDPLGLSGHDDVVPLFKAPQRGNGRRQYENGYRADDFPGGPHDPYMDGKAYFAKEQELADNYAKHYKEGVIEVQVPRSEYDQTFRQYEKPYEGGPLTEVEIPNTEVEKLNDFPRKWHK